MLRVVADPGRWALWRLPPACVAWMLVSEAGALTWAVVASASSYRPAVSDWIQFGALLGCACFYAACTRVPEERRRAADLRHSQEHVDQTSVFFFAAGLMLPVPLAVVVLLVVRAQRYVVARRSPHRYLFTTAAIATSVLGVSALARSTPLEAWLAASQSSHPGNPVAVSAALGAAVGVYFVAQAVVVGTARVLSDTRPRWALLLTAFGSAADQVLILRSLGLAVCATVALLPAHGWPLNSVLLAIATCLVIGDTGREQRLLRLGREATTDDLTGMATRKPFFERAATAAHRDRTLGRPTMISMLDVDFFKHLNDTHGHTAGDDVLREIGRRLRASPASDDSKHGLIRLGDIAARVGGEEFAVLLPSTSPAEAQAVMDRVRGGVEKMRVQTTRKTGGEPVTVSVTVSIGIAELDHDQTLDEAITVAMHQADTALYRSKRAGRNRVTLNAVADSAETSHGIGTRSRL